MREKKNQNFRRKLEKPITKNSEIMGKTHSPKSKIEDYIFTNNIYKAEPKQQSHISSLCEYPSSRSGRRRWVGWQVLPAIERVGWWWQASPPIVPGTNSRTLASFSISVLLHLLHLHAELDWINEWKQRDGKWVCCNYLNDIYREARGGDLRLG